jgi:geranylgeranyl transferase type-1 subunit beta
MDQDVQYFVKHLDMLPHHYTASDQNRMCLAYFCISALDLIHPENKVNTKIIHWVYSMQIHPTSTYPADEGYCGFRGGSFLGSPFNPKSSSPVNEYDCSHLTMTYTALCILIVLRDDLSKVDSKSIIKSLRKLQVTL